MSAETTKINEVCEQNEYEKINSKLDALKDKCNQSVLKKEEIMISNDISKFWMDLVVKRNKEPFPNEYFLLKNWVLLNISLNIDDPSEKNKLNAFNVAKELDDLINAQEDLYLDWKFNFRTVTREFGFFEKRDKTQKQITPYSNIDRENSQRERIQQIREKNNEVEEYFRFLKIFRDQLWLESTFNPELEWDLKKDENWNFVKDENWKNIKEFMPLWVERYDSKQILEADQK